MLPIHADDLAFKAKQAALRDLGIAALVLATTPGTLSDAEVVRRIRQECQDQGLAVGPNITIRHTPPEPKGPRLLTDADRADAEERCERG